jgi:hypothetical protein
MTGNILFRHLFFIMYIRQGEQYAVSYDVRAAKFVSIILHWCQLGYIALFDGKASPKL